MILKLTQIKQEDQSCFSLLFEKPKDFRFYPGQYLEIGLGKDSRSFTISASPTEDFLQVTTKKGKSKFKKTLENLKPVDMIQSTHPAGTFILDETEPAVFLAGGIGITPFRSMIKYTLDKNLTTPITLIYSNSDEDFIFRKELDSWQKQLQNLTIHYIVTSKTGRLNKVKLQQFLHSTFYLAGSPGFVDDMEKILLALRVDETNIRTDRFDGY